MAVQGHKALDSDTGSSVQGSVRTETGRTKEWYNNNHRKGARNCNRPDRPPSNGCQYMVVYQKKKISVETLEISYGEACTIPTSLGNGGQTYLSMNNEPSATNVTVLNPWTIS